MAYFGRDQRATRRDDIYNIRGETQSPYEVTEKDYEFLG